MGASSFGMVADMIGIKTHERVPASRSLGTTKSKSISLATFFGNWKADPSALRPLGCRIGTLVPQT